MIEIKKKKKERKLRELPEHTPEPLNWNFQRPKVAFLKGFLHCSADQPSLPTIVLFYPGVRELVRIDLEEALSLTLKLAS